MDLGTQNLTAKAGEAPPTTEGSAAATQRVELSPAMRRMVIVMVCSWAVPLAAAFLTPLIAPLLLRHYFGSDLATVDQFCRYYLLRDQLVRNLAETPLSLADRTLILLSTSLIFYFNLINAGAQAIATIIVYTINWSIPFQAGYKAISMALIGAAGAGFSLMHPVHESYYLLAAHPGDSQISISIKLALLVSIAFMMIRVAVVGSVYRRL